MFTFMKAREKHIAMLTGLTLNSWPPSSNRHLVLHRNFSVSSLSINSHTKSNSQEHFLDHYFISPLPSSNLQYLNILRFSWQSCLYEYINEKNRRAVIELPYTPTISSTHLPACIPLPVHPIRAPGKGSFTGKILCHLLCPQGHCSRISCFITHFLCNPALSLY